MTSRGDKVEKGMDPIIPETRVPLDPGLLGKNVVVLSLQVPCNLGKTGLVINLIAKSRSVDDGQSNPCPFLLELYD